MSATPGPRSGTSVTGESRSGAVTVTDGEVATVVMEQLCKRFFSVLFPVPVPATDFGGPKPLT